MSQFTLQCLCPYSWQLGRFHGWMVWAIVQSADLNWAPNRVGHFTHYYWVELVTSQLHYIFIVSVPGIHTYHTLIIMCFSVRQPPCQLIRVRSSYTQPVSSVPVTHLCRSLKLCPFFYFNIFYFDIFNKFLIHYFNSFFRSSLQTPTFFFIQKRSYHRISDDSNLWSQTGINFSI